MTRTDAGLYGACFVMLAGIAVCNLVDADSRALWSGRMTFAEYGARLSGHAWPPLPTGPARCPCACADGGGEDVHE